MNEDIINSAISMPWALFILYENTRAILVTVYFRFKIKLNYSLHVENRAGGYSW